MTSPPKMPSLGTYRLEERLGMGGMGEVYKAFDEKLERHVAIKLIRRDIATNPKNRRRFRREAQAIAGLNHPAIVQIYHVIEAEDRDAIVMELVSGVRLSDLLQSGPFPIDRALPLAAQIAEGLDAAHRRGILHRDLKTENVMVTEEGTAKVLDFGLARRFDRADESSITADGALLGTYRAMSPEQARGLSLDPRSDLFSFGVLLYEMLGGASPFLASQPLETLNRICTGRPTPLGELNPRVEGSLSALVHGLLEKDPARRPQSSAEVVASLHDLGAFSSSRPNSSLLPDSDALALDSLPETLIPDRQASSVPTPKTLPETTVEKAPAQRRIAVGLAFLTLALLMVLGIRFRQEPTPAAEPAESTEVRPLYVAVLEPRIDEAEGNEPQDLMAMGLRVALLRTLTDFEGIVPLAPGVVDSLVGTPVEVARSLAADEIVGSQIRCAGEICKIVLERISGADGSLLWTDSFSAESHETYGLATSSRFHLREGYASYRTAQPQDLEIRPEDYETFLRIRNDFEARNQASDPDALLARVEKLRVTAPRFAEIFQLEANILRLRYHSNRDPADLERALDVLGIGRWMFPKDPRLLFSEFEVLIKLNRFEDAEDIVKILRERQPGDATTWMLEARLLELRGEDEKGLQAMRRAVEQQPSWYHLARLADMEYRLGASDAARTSVARLLERSPGNYTGLTLGAQIELLSGHPQRAAELYSELVAIKSQITELTNLGVALLLLREYDEARERFAEAAEQAPENPLVILNLADATLLASDEAAARPLYQKVLDLFSKEEPEDWQSLSARAQALAHLGFKRDAVAGAQEILLLANENAQAAFEAALVYALADDQNSALVNVERALDLGVENVWFELPWFDGLREDVDWPLIVD